MITHRSATADAMSSAWTIAYRKRSASRFQRVQNLATDWDTAIKIGDAFKRENSDLQVFTVPTRGYDEAHPSEDAFNILVDSGKRIKITDNAPDLGEVYLAMQPNFHATGGRNRVNGTLTLAPLGALCQGHTPFSGSSFRCAGRDGQPSVAVHTWTPEGHESRNYCGYHSPYDLTPEDRTHLAASEAEFTAQLGDPINTPANPCTNPFAACRGTLQTHSTGQLSGLIECSDCGYTPNGEDYMGVDLTPAPVQRSRKIRVGDLVRFDGKLCLVRSVGSKWLKLIDMGPFATHLPRKIDRTLCTIA